MRRWLTIILLLIWVGIAGAQATPTATPTPTGPPMCSITGNVANPDGSPYVGVIKFDSSIVQIINNVPINPIQVSTGTTPSGVINPISMPQGLFTKVTMCPSASAASGCAATFTAIVPAAPTANFGSMAMGTNLINPSIVTSSLSVTGTTNLASATIAGPTSLGGTTTMSGPLSVSGVTTIASLPFTLGSATQLGDMGPAGQPNIMTINQMSGTYSPVLQFNTPTSASGGPLGVIAFGSLSTASADKRGAIITAYNNGHNNTSVPYGALQFGVANGGPPTIDMELFEDGGLAVTPTFTSGSDQGPGTINISGNYYINGFAQGTLHNWSPSVQFGGTVGSFSVYYAYYAKVANVVTVSVGIGNMTGGGAHGNWAICGLPYAAISGANQGAWHVIDFGGIVGNTGSAALFIAGGTPTCANVVTLLPTGGYTALTDANAGSANLQIGFTYLSQ